MKELSIEEKAKAYDEAIAHARLLLKTIGNATLGNLVLKNEFKTMFPALEESEDERIKKTLIKYFRNCVSLEGINGEDISNWLEKQGKEEYALKSFKDEDVRKFMQCIEKQAKAYEFNLPNRGYDIYAFAKDLLVWLEKQGKNNIGISESAKQKLKSNLSKALEKETPESWNKFLDEQKPAWSEEDERIKDNCIEYVKTACLDRNESDECIDWLKSIKERYTWKPSDEQIKVLNEVLKFAANHESPHWNDYIFGTLNNHIRQLKKLMEE